MPMKKRFPFCNPKKLKDETFINQLKELKADLFVVVAFRMLPKVIWEMPAKGTINLHASQLPNYRGAAPINWAIINGEKKTGVTTFYINEHIDTGDLIRERDEDIMENDTAGSLHDRLMKKGAEVLVESIDAIANGLNHHGFPQNQIPITHLKPAPKIFKQDCLINWNKPAREVFNFIRGLSPYPAAWTVLENKEGKKLTLKIYASTINKDIKVAPSVIEVIDGVHIYIGCSDCAIEVKELQLEGRKTMPVADFLRGFRLEEEGWHIVN